MRVDGQLAINQGRNGGEHGHWDMGCECAIVCLHFKIFWLSPRIPRARNTWTWARCSAVGGGGAAAVHKEDDIERPLRGEKFSGSRRRRFPGTGRIELRFLVAAVRNSPMVQVAPLGRDRRRVIGGDAKR